MSSPMQRLTYLQRLHYQLRYLTACNDDLRHNTDRDYRGFIKRLRKIRHEGMWNVATSGAALAYEADWAEHRLAVALGVDRRLQREHGYYDADNLSKRDLAVLLWWLRELHGHCVHLCLAEAGDRVCLLPEAPAHEWHDDYGSAWPNESFRPADPDHQPTRDLTERSV